MRNSKLRVNSALLVFEAACQGLGIIAIGDDFEYLENTNLVHVLPDEIPQSFDIYFITRKNHIQTEIHRRFFEILTT